jgi:hypothetical protein|tara:strand:- start:157 stop:753 length:597 start_codon:yes stop_codon:yes gene_type:complete
MHAAGYAFDPEFMENTKDWDAAISTGTLEVIERLCLRDAILHNKAGHADPYQMITTESEEVVMLVAQCEKELATYKEREGVFTRGSVLVNAKQMPPAQWWGNYGGHLPVLSRVATSVLAQVVCASAAERNWSIYGQIKTNKRSRMDHAVGDKMVYCHEALHLREKLQKVSYQQKVDKWESDSDSDASDDESDLKDLMA